MDSKPTTTKLLRTRIELQETISSVEKGGFALVLRPHRRGDIGWIIHRYAVLHAQQHRSGNTFEALVAEVAAQFVQQFRR